MKRLACALFIGVLSLSQVSCKKDYVCVCYSVFSGGDYTQQTVARSTKKDAQAWCKAIQASSAQPGVTTTCTLK